MQKKVKLKINPKLLKKKLKKNSGAAKHCRFDYNPELIEEIDYKNVSFLSKFITERGKILPARISGNSNKFQKRVAKEIKKSRIMALLTYSGIEY